MGTDARTLWVHFIIKSGCLAVSARWWFLILLVLDVQATTGRWTSHRIISQTIVGNISNQKPCFLFSIFWISKLGLSESSVYTQKSSSWDHSEVYGKNTIFRHAQMDSHPHPGWCRYLQLHFSNQCVREGRSMAAGTQFVCQDDSGKTPAATGWQIVTL